MDFTTFHNFQAGLFNDVISIANGKAKEYANDADRFANFNRLSKRLGIKREQVLYIYLTKHLDSIESYVRTGEVYSDEGIRGRIVDAITYLTILAGMIEEDRMSKGTTT